MNLNRGLVCLGLVLSKLCVWKRGGRADVPLSGFWGHGWKHPKCKCIQPGLFRECSLWTSRGWVAVSVYLGCAVWVSSTAILVLVLLQCKQNLWAMLGACPSVFCACCFVLFHLQPSNVTLCRPGRSWFKSKEVDLVESVRMAEIAEMFKSGLLLILKVASLKWPINTMFTFVCSD